MAMPKVNHVTLRAELERKLDGSKPEDIKEAMVGMSMLLADALFDLGKARDQRDRAARVLAMSLPLNIVLLAGFVILW